MLKLLKKNKKHLKPKRNIENKNLTISNQVAKMKKDISLPILTYHLSYLQPNMLTNLLVHQPTKSLKKNKIVKKLMKKVQKILTSSLKK